MMKKTSKKRMILTLFVFATIFWISGCSLTPSRGVRHPASKTSIEEGKEKCVSSAETTSSDATQYCENETLYVHKGLEDFVFAKVQITKIEKKWISYEGNYSEIDDSEDEPRVREVAIKAGFDVSYTSNTSNTSNSSYPVESGVCNENQGVRFCVGDAVYRKQGFWRRRRIYPGTGRIADEGRITHKLSGATTAVGVGTVLVISALITGGASLPPTLAAMLPGSGAIAGGLTGFGILGIMSTNEPAPKTIPTTIGRVRGLLPNGNAIIEWNYQQGFFFETKLRKVTKNIPAESLALAKRLTRKAMRMRNKLARKTGLKVLCSYDLSTLRCEQAIKKLSRDLGLAGVNVRKRSEQATSHPYRFIFLGQLRRKIDYVLDPMRYLIQIDVDSLHKTRHDTGQEAVSFTSFLFNTAIPESMEEMQTSLREE